MAFEAGRPLSGEQSAIVARTFKIRIAGRRDVIATYTSVLIISVPANHGLELAAFYTVRTARQFGHGITIEHELSKFPTSRSKL